MASNSTHPVVAIVGATGLVGRELLSILATHPLGEGELRLLASPRSAGTLVKFRGRSLTVAPLKKGSLAGVDIAIFSAGSSVTKEFGPPAVAAGVTVVDNSSAFRMDEAVPLIVPEINGHVLDAFRPPGIIAVPNCSTIVALMAVAPLHRAFGVERMVVSTYQAASGAGARYVEELEQQTRQWAAGEPLTTEVTGRQYVFNVFSHNSALGPDGYNEEERKLVRETHKILEDDSIRITATCVRVPVLRTHSEAINLTLRRPAGEHEARLVLAEAPGVIVLDDRPGNNFPEPRHATGRDEVFVGRIRADHSQPPGMGLNLWVAGDQLRKGAALDAVQIAERVAGTLAATR